VRRAKGEEPWTKTGAGGQASAGGDARRKPLSQPGGKQGRGPGGTACREKLRKKINPVMLRTNIPHE